MIETGYTFDEVTDYFRSEDRLSFVIALKDLNYSAEAAAVILRKLPADEITAANDLIQAGYGSCGDLIPVIQALAQVYGIKNTSYLRAIFVDNIGCDEYSFTIAIDTLVQQGYFDMDRDQ
jgi:hypothetical protein